MNSEIKITQEAIKEKVASMLRSCLVSSKEGVRLSELLKDYKLVTGMPIPFRDMGFSSLEEFVRNIPNHVTVSRNRSGELVCMAVIDGSISHIARMVAQQKPSKKPAKKAPQAHSLRGRELPARNPTKNVPFQPSKSNYRTTYHKSDRQYAATPPSPPNERRRMANYKPHNLPPRFQNKQLRQPAAEPPVLQNQPVEERPTYQRQPVEKPPTSLRHSVEEPATSLRYSVEDCPAVITNPADEASPYAFQPLPSPPVLQQPVKSYKELLEKYCIEHNISNLTFRTVPIGNASFYCLLQFGDKKYGSYPEHFTDINEAQEMVAKKVVDALNEENKACPFTESRTVYLHRLEQLMANRSNGMWISALETLYKETYKERLPSNWINFTDSAALRLEEIRGGNIGKIVYPGKRKQERRVPPPPKAKPDEHWDAYVCYFGSTADLAIRFVDIENRFETMTEQLQDRYNGTPPEYLDVDLQNTYAAQIDGEWFRVVTLAVCGGEAQCYLVDVGDKDNVPIRNLRALDDQFFQLPSQALHAQLAGLEELCDLSELNELWRPQILDRTFVARVVHRDDFNAIYLLNLYDTSTDVDRDVNEELVDQYLASVIPPKFPDIHEVCEAYMCHISQNGATYLQFSNPTFDILFGSLENYQKKIDELAECPLLETDKVYVVKNSEGFYYRAYYTGVTQNMKHQVFFFDFGDTEFVFRDVIKDPLHLPSGRILSGIPPQAISCKLYLLHDSICDARDKLIKMVPPYDQVLVRVSQAEPDADGLQEVELFKRVDEALVSINSTVGLQLHQVSNGTLNRGDSNNNIRKAVGRGRGAVREDSSRVSSPESMNSLSSEQTLDSSPLTSLTPPPETTICPNPLHAIPSPELPAIGSNFDVLVTLAANPSNFSVQSYKDIDKLNSLRTQMHEYYSLSDNQKDATPDSIEESGYYAILHNDDSWYRIQVKNKMDGEMFSGLLIDYGDFVVTSCSSLLHLHQQFHSLPAQAFKAKLSDVDPIHGDWTVEDGIEFKQLVQDLPFVSFVKGTSNSEDGSALLSLQLIDTSHPIKDVYIDRKLVAEGRAIASS